MSPSGNLGRTEGRGTDEVMPWPRQHIFDDIVITYDKIGILVYITKFRSTVKFEIYGHLYAS